ncbi:MAG: helicase RepA family protein [Burkholderiaceae bacterium]
MTVAEMNRKARSLEALDAEIASHPPSLPYDDERDQPKTLHITFADDLPADFQPPDELVEGLLTVGACSILYGDSNSGKTFAAVDIACAVAQGVAWMGKRTEPGLVVYLAAESPASLRARLQAYQSEHGVKVPDFAVVNDPVNLWNGNADTDAIIAAVRQIEAERGKPARLIIGDTLSRLSAGGNENSGEDMGLVVQRIDRMRAETGAHVLIIHHSGKIAANGARGWSGIRAAVDTEMEVKDEPQGRCIEITKQRDLSGKGDRIGFRLVPVVLGLTKWGTPATSCIVVSADAPVKLTKGKRTSEAGGAILEFLRSLPSGVRQAQVANHFCNRYDKSTISRQLKALVNSGAVVTAAGMFAINSELR